MHSPIGKVRLNNLAHDVKYDPPFKSYVDHDNCKIVVNHDNWKIVPCYANSWSVYPKCKQTPIV